MFNQQNIIETAHALQSEGKSFVMATVVRTELSTAAKPGSKAIITDAGEIIGWVGGGCVQPAVKKHAKICLESGTPTYVRVSPETNAEKSDVIEYLSSCASKGSTELFLDPFISAPKLGIFGTSPVSFSLERMATEIGLSVFIIANDIDKQSYLPSTSLQTSLLSSDDVESLDYAVVSTQGRLDEKALELALKSSAKHIIFIASQTKAQKYIRKLSDKGWSNSDIKRIHSPAGLDINAETPAEIAVAITAQLIQLRRSVNQSSNISPSVTQKSCCSHNTA